MGTPQQGIFEEGSNAFYFLEYTRTDADDSALRHAIREIATPHPKVDCVISFGPRLLEQIAPKICPKNFHALQPISTKFLMPATQRDLFFWIKGNSHDQVFEKVLQIQRVIKPIAKLELELRGFTYKDSRDLIGFVDGTANPKDNDRFLAASLPDGVVGAGGSFVLSQQWEHQLTDFHALPLSKQEAIVGRTKVDDIELEGAEMPNDSHVSRTDVKLDGVAQKIWRRSAPYGSASVHGLYFLAFSCEQRRFQLQLERMYGATEDGLHDRLIEYSNAVTGSYWFAPSKEDLNALMKVTKPKNAPI